MKVLIAAGGTGGHLFPGVAIAQEWQRRRAVDVVFAGTAAGLERQLLPRIGYRLELLHVERLIGRGWRTIGAMVRLPRSLWEAWRLLRHLRPDLVIGIGGYASGPLLFMAAVTRYPSVVVEPNALPGVTNRILAPLVDLVISAFEFSRRYLRARRLLVLGNPIRQEVINATRPPASVEAAEQPSSAHESRSPVSRTVLVLGGSQGAHAINQLVVDALDLLGPLRERIWFVHQTGEKDAAWVRQAYDHRGIGGRVEPFIHAMGEAYAQADLVISRAGATTIAELTACGKASLLIPFPFSAHQHQRYNAQLLQEAGAALLCEESELTGQGLADLLGELLQDGQRLEAMAEASRRLGRPDAARSVVEACETLIGAAAS